MEVYVYFFCQNDTLEYELRKSSEENNTLPLVYKERKNILKRTCNKYRHRIEIEYRRLSRLTKRTRRVSESMRYSKNNVPFIWCLVPKVGSTSWVKLFLQVWFSNPMYKENKEYHVALSSAWKKTEKSLDLYFWKKLSKNTFSFLFSRHPFERILSAYRDKLEFATETLLERYGGRILQKYRKHKPSDEKYANIPTFREFVEYLVNEPISAMNRHWIPISDLCMPCHIDYDIIGRKDTMKADSEVILNKIGIEEELQVTHVSGGKGSDQTLKEYYSQLDIKLLNQLYKLYELDFLLFNYTIDSYLPYVTTT